MDTVAGSIPRAAPLPVPSTIPDAARHPRLVCATATEAAISEQDGTLGTARVAGEAYAPPRLHGGAA
jgi:hypothetical protein